MKKSLLALGLAALAFGANAQNATNAEIGGNLPNDDKTGYTYNFGNTLYEDTDIDFEVANWLNSGSTIPNTFGETSVTFGGDYQATEGCSQILVTDQGSAIFTHDGTVADAFQWISTRFGYGNGDVGQGANVIDYSAVANQVIKARVFVEPDADNPTGLVQDVNLLIAAAVDDGGWELLTAGGDAEYQAVTPSVWTTVNFTMVPGSLATTAGIGFSYRLVNVDDDANNQKFKGKIYFEWIEFGAAVGTKTDCVNSLEDEAAAVNFTAYPNPATNVVNFSSDVEGTIELANALGSVVTSTEGTSINVSELPAGVYFATLKVNGEATAVQRIQVQ